MHSNEEVSELGKTRMIACLAIILNYSLAPTLLFCFSDSFYLASLCHSRLLFNLFPFLLWCVAILLSAALARATPAHVKCAVRRAVKVICRRARERTIEKTILTHKYIYSADFH